MRLRAIRAALARWLWPTAVRPERALPAPVILQEEDMAQDPTVKAMVARGKLWMDANPGECSVWDLKGAMRHVAPNFTEAQCAAALLALKAEFQRRKKG
jgi:hypothetical protein